MTSAGFWLYEFIVIIYIDFSPLLCSEIISSARAMARATRKQSIKSYKAMHLLCHYFSVYMVDSVELKWCTPANTKHLHNIYTTSAPRLRGWSHIVYMLYTCFICAGACIQLCYYMLIAKQKPGSRGQTCPIWSAISWVWYQGHYQGHVYRVSAKSCHVWLPALQRGLSASLWSQLPW